MGKSPDSRGQYLVRITDCGGCHTPGALAGKPDASRQLAGSDIGFGGPWGVAYPRNLTPDKETGLGAWTDAEIIRALRQGQSRDGRPLAPIMPWPSYAALAGSRASLMKKLELQHRRLARIATARVCPRIR